MPVTIPSALYTSYALGQLRDIHSKRIISKSLVNYPCQYILVIGRSTLPPLKIELSEQLPRSKLTLNTPNL